MRLAPHTDGVNILLGRAQPSQTLPPGGGRGKPGFPISLLERQSVATKVTAPSPALPRWGRESGSSPQRGEAGRGAERGERFSPQPSMRLAPHPDGMNILLGRAQPSQTLPRAGIWGNQVSPYPCVRARPARGRGRGEPRVPHSAPTGGLRVQKSPHRHSMRAVTRDTEYGSPGVPLIFQILLTELAPCRGLEATTVSP